MRKIPTLYLRDFDNGGVLLDTINPECAWVDAGLGVATYKWDGTAIKYHHEVWYVRRTVKNIDRDTYHSYMLSSDLRGNDRFPPHFKLESYDNVTRKAFGWVPATGTQYERYLIEALRNHHAYWLPGTYELVGPKINGNRHHLDRHHLKRHGIPIAGADVPTDYDELEEYLTDFRYEGVVWYGTDGSMAKIKRRDFGLE